MRVTTEPTDAELIGRIASGDREALALVFRRHQRTVFRFSRQMLGSTEAAEDVTQDVFVALAKSAGRFDPDVASLSTYLYGIARHLVLQRYKKSRGRTEISLEAAAVEGGAAFATSSDPADAISRAQATRQLRSAILRLPVHYREVLVLCELNGLSYEEAAAIARCPVGTVRSRLSRARQMLIDKCRNVLTTETRLKCLIPTKNNC